MVRVVGAGVGDVAVQRRQSVHAVCPAVGHHLPVTAIRRWHVEDPAIQLLPVTRSTLERIPSSMARNRKRSRRGESAPQEAESEFYVTVAHEPGAACDVCAQPRPVLIETEHGEWWCEVCTGDVDGNELWRAAVIALMGNDGL
jgi:hypothetical protein